MIQKISAHFLLSVVYLFSNPGLALSATPAVSGSVIDADALSRGGTLAIAAFKPGPGAIADELTDKMSDMLIKGIRKSLLNHPSSLEALDGEDLTMADFLLEGYIEEFTRSGKLARWALLKNQAYLSVDGEIWFEKSGAKVLVFTSSVIINMKKEKPLDVAYQMGKSIGNFITAHVTKE